MTHCIAIDNRKTDTRHFTSKSLKKHKNMKNIHLYRKKLVSHGVNKFKKEGHNQIGIYAIISSLSNLVNVFVTLND